MVYSPSKKSIFCFYFRLFNIDEQESGISKDITGFQHWWKLNPKVCQHEYSDEHLANLEQWKILGARLQLNKTIDSVHQENQEAERKK